MKSNQFIIIEDFCQYYSIEVSFVKKLSEQGMVELIHQDTSYFVHHDDIGQLEKYMHFYYDLGINLEGLEAISHLLEKIENLQSKIRQTKIY